MIKKDVAYNDVMTGEPRVAECYFHLSKAEILKLEVSCPGGLEAYALKAAEEENREAIFDLIWKIVVTAYGTKAADGSFVKSRAETEKFSQSEAFSELLISIMESPETLEAFIKGVKPREN